MDSFDAEKEVQDIEKRLGVKLGNLKQRMHVEDSNLIFWHMF